MIRSFYSLRKSKKAFHHFGRLFKRKGKSLSLDSKKTIQEYLTLLQGSILQKDAPKAKYHASELKSVCERFMPKTALDRFRDFCFSMGFALVVAVLIRTMWFELYTIPTGSMRPTLKENDFLVVSKTDYGINVPLKPKHFYFDENLVKRGSIIIFNGANMDIEDNETMYFFLFPGKKQFVKRMIGKPGDTIYFYGGEIYGIDKEGQKIGEFGDFQKLYDLEHIPFIRWEGKIETPYPPNGGIFSTAIFNQMNQPVVQLSANNSGTVNGEMIGKKNFQYSDFLGMKNFAMARLLNEQQMGEIYPQELRELEKGELYLELTHSPHLQGASLIRDDYQRLRPALAKSLSFIPLQKRHIEAIHKHMTTCRFVVKNGMAYRFGMNPNELSYYLVPMEGIPDGTYEIQNGKVYKLPCTWLPLFGGISYAVSEKHPLYDATSQQVQLLYNLGIEFLKIYEPSLKNQKMFLARPSRYAYFKNNDLYLLANPVIPKNDPALISFNQKEEKKKYPFKDFGPPSVEDIRKYGIQVPEKMYLVLGDNHAMSGDSRQFGFVPEDNLKGGVSFLFSPPDSRWGKAPQPSQPYCTLPNIAVWVFFILFGLGYSLYMKRKLKKSFN